jgi:hypothetical protein
MKKILLIALDMIMAVTFCSCSNKTIEGEEAWNKFSSALELTSALEYYSIMTSENTNGIIENGKIVLSSDVYERSVAYKQSDNVQMWWVNGIAYINDGQDKLKQAQSINSFLEISDSDLVWTYDMVENVKLADSVITFNVTMANFDECKVRAELGKLFLNEITVAVKKNIDSEIVNQSFTYTYENAGSKPTITLPDDLENYHF